MAERNFQPPSEYAGNRTTKLAKTGRPCSCLPVLPKLPRSPKLLPWLWLIALLLSWRNAAQETVTEYILLPDSRLTDDCWECASPPFPFLKH